MIRILLMTYSRIDIFFCRMNRNNSLSSKNISVTSISYWIYILLLFPKIILGVTPGKWSHIDKYIFGNNSNGPVKKSLKMQTVR